jgi:hypothetical protein
MPKSCVFPAYSIHTQLLGMTGGSAAASVTVAARPRCLSDALITGKAGQLQNGYAARGPGAGQERES